MALLKRLFTFFLFIVAVKTHAIDSSGFAKLTNQEQKDLVKTIMELTVAMEARYQVEMGPEKKRLQVFLDQIREALLQSAYADDQKNEDPFTLALSTYQNLEKYISSGKKCIYAGWASYTNDKNVCVHPRQINRGAPYKPMGQCSKTNEITCQPGIFGFKEGNTPFCVEAYPGHENTSLNCMELALNTPDVNKRLEAIAKAWKENPALFDTVVIPALQMCLCEKGIDVPKGLNATYQSKMRPHRTCYALMNQLSEVFKSGQCETTASTILGNESLTQTKDLLTKITTSDVKDKNTSSFDKKYADLLNLSLKEENNKQIKTQICTGVATPPVPTETGSGEEITCDLKCKKVVTETNISMTCWWGNDEKNSSDYSPSTTQLEHPKKKDLWCDVQLEEDTPTDSGEEDGKGFSIDSVCDGKQCVLTALLDGKSLPDGYKVLWSQPKLNEDGSQTEESKGEGVTLTVPQLDQDYLINAKLSKDDKDEGNASVTIPAATSGEDEDEPVVTNDSYDVTKVCEATTCLLTATVLDKENKNNSALYKIEWYKKSANPTTTADDKKEDKNKSKGAAADGDTEADPNTTTEGDDEKDDAVVDPGLTLVSTGLTYSAPKETTVVEICAKFKLASDNSEKAQKCVSIEALAAPTQLPGSIRQGPAQTPKIRQRNLRFEQIR